MATQQTPAPDYAEDARLAEAVRLLAVSLAQAMDDAQAAGLEVMVKFEQVSVDLTSMESKGPRISRLTHLALCQVNRPV